MTAPITTEQKIQADILANLRDLADKRVGTDKITYKGNQIILPDTMTLTDSIKTLVDYAKDQESIKTFPTTFNYRPWDGAAAVQSALMKHWGNAGRGVGMRSMFGSSLPNMPTIKVGPTVTVNGHKETPTMQVPWGTIYFAPLDAQIELGSSYSGDYGMIFSLSVSCANKYAEEVDGFFKLVQMELENNSIYRGKAFDGAEEPTFIDPFSINEKEVVYSAEALAHLEALVWVPLRYTEACHKLNVSLKRATLLAGPYGTGKSLAAMITAQIATANGWTFIQCRPEDDLKRTLQTARLYQPAVVFYEDVDVLSVTGASDPKVISELLNTFDGIQAKGTQLSMVLTSNHEDEIHKGLMRPGRLDAMIEIGALDHNGFVRLLQACVPDQYLPHDERSFEEVEVISLIAHNEEKDGAIDWDLVADEMEGFLPAFIKEVAERAKLYAIARVKGEVYDGFLRTSDFVLAARGLRPQLELMEGAKETITPDTLQVAMEKVVTSVIAGGEVGIYDRDKQHRFTLASVDNE